jgi:diguanylate cyclase (GGDEF)-like protein/PAS domain S-box-containing protein
VFLTSHSDETTLSRARDAAPFGYVLKPFNEPALLSAIQVALQRHELETRLAERTALLEGILRAMSDAVVAVDPAGKVLLANEAAQLGGVARLDLRASGFFEASRPPPGRFDRRSLVQALRGEVVREAEVALPAPGAEARWLSTNASPLLGARGEILGGVAVTRDITALKRTQLELERLAIVDELTGLYNRRGFQTLGEQQLKLARRTRHAPTLVFVDVDDMKTINDSYGHKAGDRALCDTALVLRESFRESDILGRLGGDEFVVFAVDAGDRRDLLRDRVYARLEQLNARGENPYRLSLSVGVLSCRPEEAHSIEALIALADDLMYERKSARPSRVAEELRVVRRQGAEET